MKSSTTSTKMLIKTPITMPAVWLCDTLLVASLLSTGTATGPNLYVRIEGSTDKC